MSPTRKLPASSNVDPDAKGSATSPVPPSRITHRLSVNINDESADVLRRATAKHGISTTEAVRRAIGLLKFFEEEQDSGNEVLTRDRVSGELSKVVQI